MENNQGEVEAWQKHECLCTGHVQHSETRQNLEVKQSLLNNEKTSGLTELRAGPRYDNGIVV